MDTLSSFCRSSVSFMGMKMSSSPPPLSRQQVMDCGGNWAMCLERWVWVPTTAKLLHPTAAGNASPRPVVSGSRRRSLLQPCSDPRAGKTSLVWDLQGSLRLILGQPCSVANKAGVYFVYCRVPCSRGGALQVGFRSPFTPHPGAAMGVLQWGVLKTQP